MRDRFRKIRKVNLLDWTQRKGISQDGTPSGHVECECGTAEPFNLAQSGDYVAISEISLFESVSSGL
ncbi:hypothetical protein EDC90_10774 [Martelella mediterranea]|uniref:Uncharacterized protein n=1 Tax=Martelella mediterranea TaxID=293089 RepID=A0A4R3NC43_9HYPH|nr:hypothetical protein EDC90_10774 [Martelella mediterranea]